MILMGVMIERVAGLVIGKKSVTVCVRTPGQGASTTAVVPRSPVIETLVGISALQTDREDGADGGGLAYLGLAFRAWFGVEEYGDAVFVALVEDGVSSRNALP